MEERRRARESDPTAPLNERIAKLQKENEDLTKANAEEREKLKQQLKSLEEQIGSLRRELANTKEQLRLALQLSAGANADAVRVALQSQPVTVAMLIADASRNQGQDVKLMALVSLGRAQDVGSGFHPENSGFSVTLSDGAGNSMDAWFMKSRHENLFTMLGKAAFADQPLLLNLTIRMPARFDAQRGRKPECIEWSVPDVVGGK